MRHETATVEIPAIPPSLNSSYIISTRGGRVRRFPAREVAEWKLLVHSVAGQVKLDKADWYGIELTFTFPLYFKNGKPRKKDVDNLAKHTIDAIVPCVSIDGEPLDDCMIRDVYVTKVDGKQEETSISIYAII